MSIKTEAELEGMRRVSAAVAITLRKMREKAAPGMTTAELDEFGAEILASFGARSAPILMYNFPGHTCISLNHEIAHGIPSTSRTLKDGDLVNIDVSAELDGYFADNGGSFVLGDDVHGYQALVDASRTILKSAIQQIRSGLKISSLGKYIEGEARSLGFRVIRNLAGHGVGKSLHEEPMEILNCYDGCLRGRFMQNSVVAVETFISTKSNVAEESGDGWTLVGNKGGFTAQHEHTLVVTDGSPEILTEANQIWN